MKLAPRIAFSKRKLPTRQAGDDLSNLKQWYGVDKHWQGTRQKKRSGRWLIMAGFVLTIAIVGYYTRSAPSKTDERLAMTVEAEQTVAAGALVKQTVTVVNNLTVTVRDLNLEILPPGGWLLKQAEPVSLTERRLQWAKESLLPGEQWVIDMDGWLFGHDSAKYDWSAEVFYQPDNFRSQFSASNRWQQTVTGSGFDLAMERESKQDGSAGFTVKVKNKEIEQILPPDLKLKLKFPSGFVASAFDPSPEDSLSYRWPVTNLNEQKEFKLTFQGTGQLPDSSSAIEAVLVWQDGRTAAQYETAKQTILVNAPAGPLTAVVKVNGSERPNGVDWGTTVQWELLITNNTTETVTDLEIRGHLTAELTRGVKWLDKNSQLIKTASFDPSLGMITLRPDNLTSLKKLEQGDTSQVTLQADLLSFTDLKNPSLIQAYSVDNYFEITGRQADKELTIATTQLKAPFNGYWQLNAQARYYQDDSSPVGTGPLPPKVGSATRYRVNWRLTNTTHTLQAMKVKTTLPNSVEWISQAEPTGYGSVSYDKETRAVTWELNQVPAAASVNGRTVLASFDVSLTPIASQIGTEPKLTEDVQASALDTVTGSELLISNDGLTTALVGDPVGAGKGTVVQ
ncbi:MAG: hypothetical protein V1707_03255 [bacterium]